MKPEENPFIAIPLTLEDLQQNMTIELPTFYVCAIIQHLNPSLHIVKDQKEQELIQAIVNNLSLQVIQCNKKLRKKYLEDEN